MECSQPDKRADNLKPSAGYLPHTDLLIFSLVTRQLVPHNGNLVLSSLGEGVREVPTMGKVGST